MTNAIRAAAMIVAMFAAIQGASADATESSVSNKSARRAKRSVGGDSIVASLRIRPFVATATGSDRLLQRPAKGVRRRACPRCTIPDYAYSSDHRSVAGEIAFKADTTSGSVKRFNTTKPPLTVEHLQLDRIGLRLDDQGQFVFSGRITHSGPEDLPGSAVTVRLRAYSAATAAGDELLDAPVLWKSQAHYVWVRRGEPRRVRIAMTGKNETTDLKRYYQEITHIEVELRYHEGR